jgi:hypothetical protein
VVVIEAEGVAMQGIGNFVTVVRELGNVGHGNTVARREVLLHVQLFSYLKMRSLAKAPGRETFRSS